MWLRLLASQWAQQAARDKLQEVVANYVQAQRRTADDPAAADQADASDAPPPPPVDVAVIFALAIEAGGLIDMLADSVSSKYANCVEHLGRIGDQQVLIVECGVGRKAAGAVTEEVLEQHKPAWVVSAGFAGGLQDGLRRGHVVMPQQVVDASGRELETGLRLSAESLAAQPSLHAGRLLTVDQLVRTEQEKRRLAERHQAIACDMETLAVAEACGRKKTRFLSVRVVTDAVTDQLPPEVENLMEQKTWAGKLGAAAGAILNRPSSVKEIWRLREEAIKASDRLAKFLRGTLPQLR